MTLGSGETLKALNRVNPLKFVLVEKPLGRHLQPSGELFRLPQNLNLVDKSGGAGGRGQEAGQEKCRCGFSLKGKPRRRKWTAIRLGIVTTCSGAINPGLFYPLYQKD